MNELGQILREARENKGLTLAEVQEETRIHARFLDALETGSYETLPTPVHVRGFLRNYARFLSLDPKPLLDRYQSDQHPYASAITSEIPRQASAGQPIPLRQDQPFFDPVNMEVEANGRRSTESALQLVIIAALILTLGLIGVGFIPRLLGNTEGSDNITAEISGALQEMVASGELEPTIDVNATLTATDVITSTSRNETTSAVIVPTPLPTRPPLPSVMESIQLRLEIVERTWMEVTIDDDVVFSGIARANDFFEWEATQEAKLLTGNAIGIVATINDVQLGRLGGRGENREEIWQTTQ
ncbi:MAG: RodZ domain-containing protein [Chloroflexota bacterium]